MKKVDLLRNTRSDVVYDHAYIKDSIKGIGKGGEVKEIQTIVFPFNFFPKSGPILLKEPEF